MAKLEPEFTKRGVKLIGLSANTIESHGGWINDINEIAGVELTFPIIGDKNRQIAFTYDMLVILLLRAFGPVQKVRDRSNFFQPGSTIKTQLTLTPVALHLPSVPSSSSTQRRLFVSSNHILPPLAATPTNCYVLWTRFSTATSIALPHLSTGYLVKMSSSTQASRMRRRRDCSQNSA